MSNLQRELDAAKRLKEWLKTEMADDAEVVATAIEGETNLLEAIDETMSAALEAEAMAEALAGQVALMTERKRRFEKRAERMREAVLDAMQEVEITKLERPRFTLSTRAVPKSVVITDEAALPDCFKRVKTEPDKKLIKAALDNGEAVPGAELSNGGISLAVREA